MEQLCQIFGHLNDHIEKLPGKFFYDVFIGVVAAAVWIWILWIIFRPSIQLPPGIVWTSGRWSDEQVYVVKVLNRSRWKTLTDVEIYLWKAYDRDKPLNKKTMMEEFDGEPVKFEDSESIVIGSKSYSGEEGYEYFYSFQSEDSSLSKWFEKPREQTGIPTLHLWVKARDGFSGLPRVVSKTYTLQHIVKGEYLSRPDFLVRLLGGETVKHVRSGGTLKVLTVSKGQYAPSKGEP